MKMLARSAVMSLVLAAPALADDELAAVNQPAPMFRLPVYNAAAVGASAVGLDRYVGDEPQEPEARLVLLSFMASFCEPCKREMPYLQSLHERYKDLGLRVMMVSIDTEAEGQKKVDELIAKNKVTFPVLKDRFNLVARRWLGSQSPLPSVFFVRADGTVATIHRGYDQDAASLLAKEIQLLLSQKGAITATAAKP